VRVAGAARNRCSHGLAHNSCTRLLARHRRNHRHCYMRTRWSPRLGSLGGAGMMAGMVAIGAAVRGAGGGWGGAGMMAGMVAIAMGGAGMTRLI
jgi:hypothetical protein